MLTDDIVTGPSVDRDSNLGSDGNDLQDLVDEAEKDIEAQEDVTPDDVETDDAPTDLPKGTLER